ncbi:MAG TPA: hypothetical protein VF041_23275 [Gemmatimonadaceae bacterium]
MGLRVISMGGGVQSTALLVLAAQGVLDFPVALFPALQLGKSAYVCYTGANERTMPERAANTPGATRKECAPVPPQYTPLPQLTQVEIGYLAGIIDGEGTISVMYYQSKTGRAPSLTCRLSIGNTNLDLLRWVESVCGGKIHLNTNVRMQRAKLYYNWALLGRPALDTIALVEPHLKIKRQQAILAAQIDALLLPRFGDNRLRVVTDELRKKREALVAEFRRLNGKGVAS